MRAESRPHLVVKIGGSLCGSPLLPQWMAALRVASFALTIVSGGGPFADAVRATQPKMGFSDDAAHRMALLAMEQYALALADRFEDLALAASLDDMRGAHARGCAAVWRPSAMVATAIDIPANWDVTSDSLAAWLARRAKAAALLLVKSVDAGDGDPVARGIVDPAISAYVGDSPVFIAGPSALAGAAQHLASGAVPGARILSLSSQKIAS